VGRRTYLLDEREDIAHRTLEAFLVHGVIADREVADNCMCVRRGVSKAWTKGVGARTVRQVIVYRIVLRREISEEELREVRDPRLVVLETLCHFAELAFDFDHAVQDEMREHHQCVFLHDEVGV
jgi:hypothetical protein